MSPKQFTRREARQRGIPFDLVEGVYEELAAAERDKREHDNAVREYAWTHAVTPGSWPFWRHGFFSRWGKLIEEGDYTYVPGFDHLATIVAGRFPEYAGRDGCARLWAFLMSPYNKLPAPIELWERALDRAADLHARRAEWQCSSSEPVWSEDFV